MSRLVRVKSHYRRVGRSSGGVVLLVLLAPGAAALLLIYAPWIAILLASAILLGDFVIRYGTKRWSRTEGVTTQYTNGYTAQQPPVMALDNRYIPEHVKMAVH